MIGRRIGYRGEDGIVHQTARQVLVVIWYHLRTENVNHVI